VCCKICDWPSAARDHKRWTFLTIGVELLLQIVVFNVLYILWVMNVYTCKGLPGKLIE